MKTTTNTKTTATKDSKLSLADLAARISKHLERFEKDPKINKLDPHYKTREYYCASASLPKGSRKVSVLYVSYQGSTKLSREEAESYLAWLDAGNVGSHKKHFSLGSLFSGIGGLDLGLELAGFGPTLYHVEQNAFARVILGKHWPRSLRFTDVREVGENLPYADVIAGGFPCQGFSQAGLRKGFCDPRSSLWHEMRRIITMKTPRAVVVENVVEMARVGAHETVVADLQALGYECDTPTVLDAAQLGAPHHRLRVFIVGVRPGDRVTLGPPRGKVLPTWPAPRGPKQYAWEPRRTLDKATRYAGSFKRERLHALGNAVIPAMGYAVGMRLRERLAGAPANHGPFEMPRAARAKDHGLWPTAVTTDAKGARRETARSQAVERGVLWKSNPGTTLTDAVWLSRPDDYDRPLNPLWVEALMGFPNQWTLPEWEPQTAGAALLRGRSAGEIP